MPGLRERLSDALGTLAGAEGKAMPGPLTDLGPRLSAPEVYGTQLSSHSGSRFAAGTAKRQLEAYGSGTSRAIDWVADCMGVIAETLAYADWHFEDMDGTTKPRNRSEAEPNARLADPWLVQLLEEPNGYQSYDDLMQLFAIDRFITGDGFLLKRGMSDDGHPLELHRLPPQWVDVIPGKNGRLIEKYEYKVPGQEPVSFPAERVIHWKGPNPHDSFRGAGIIAMGPRVFDMEVALTDAKASFYENGARLSGVLESDQAVSDSLAAKLRRQFHGIYGGVKQAFQVAVLGRGVTYKAIQATPADAEFNIQSDQSRDRILALFRVPRAMLGLAIDTSSTTAPAEERRVFANTRMRPILDDLQRLITRELTSDFGLVFKVDYEYQMPIEDQWKLGGEFAKVPGVMVKEVREQFNLPPLREVYEKLPEEETEPEVDPITGEKKPYKPALQEAVEIENKVLNMPGEDAAKGGFGDQPLPGEPGRPAKPSNGATFDEESQREGTAVK